jgi:hypothetical protein
VEKLNLWKLRDPICYSFAIVDLNWFRGFASGPVFFYVQRQAGMKCEGK